jgi:hypothetical protein
VVVEALEPLVGRVARREVEPLDLVAAQHAAGVDGVDDGPLPGREPEGGRRERR